jgi:hypothetical protein
MGLPNCPHPQDRGHKADITGPGHIHRQGQLSLGACPWELPYSGHCFFILVLTVSHWDTSLPPPETETPNAA